MDDFKITVDQLKNYLGTGLKIHFSTTRGVKHHTLDIHNITDAIKYTSNYKILVYRLSDLDKEIEVDGERFVPAVELSKLITQSGWQSPIQSIKQEDNTITVAFAEQHGPGDMINQPFFEIDIDEDFGFGIYSKKWPERYPKRYEEVESCTGNIWQMYQKLFEWHFWPFGEEYFTEGLVLDKMVYGKEVTNG